ncbi:hypothetical protein Sme01_45980 [Sphaerisporangium melleum]|uniref:Uncharacterized protein n=1 Tax=Sphaerisporangium melleum TaxID=321316 RepID=A0A917VHZ1_9ACTN|nr:hypothetical protein [Sphaerisporangium melleum]GGK79847.1 hypothetical protein GCM10007964_23100 [Sphaerisporangium melleum]GII72122.1 hypothetical protein Sme01_45980 [Sphaerisporangium melleum]
MVAAVGGPSGERWTSAIVDPELPDDVAGLLRGNARMLSRVRAGWIPPPPAELEKSPMRRLRILIAGGVWLALVALLIAGLIDRVVFTFLFALVLLTYLLTRGGEVGDEDERPDDAERRVYEHARRYQGRYLLPEDFDLASRELLMRTRSAVSFVLRSRVHREGLLDDVRDAVVLPAQEWDIARLLAKLSALRTEHNEIVGATTTRELSAVTAPLERALAAGEAAVVARVKAVERYARHVAEAERAYQARDQIEALHARLPRYEDLLAEAGSDRMAVPELRALAEDAERLEEALRESVRSARHAFRHLDGPEELDAREADPPPPA